MITQFAQALKLTRTATAVLFPKLTDSRKKG